MQQLSETFLLVVAILLVKYILPQRKWARYLSIIFVVMYCGILFGSLFLTPQVDSFIFKIWGTISSGWSYYVSYFVFILALIYAINVFNRRKS